MTNTGDRGEEQPYDDLYRKGNSQGPSLVHHFSLSGLKLKLIKIYDNYYLTPTPPVSRQVVPQQFKIVQWTKSICPYMTLDHYSCLPILSASFCHLYLQIHFNRDNKRNSLFRRFEWRFQENIGKHLHCNVQDKSRVTYTRIPK